MVSGGYTLVTLGSDDSPRFVLFDDRTGTRSRINARGCDGDPTFGAPWVLFFCNLKFKLYNIATRTWRPLDPPRSALSGGSVVGYALGLRWLEFDPEGNQDCGDHIHFDCGPETYVFYNLGTHKVRYRWPASPTTIVDLDSPTLVRSVCKPLGVSKGGSLTSTAGSRSRATSRATRCWSGAAHPCGGRSPSRTPV